MKKLTKEQKAQRESAKRVNEHKELAKEFFAAGFAIGNAALAQGDHLDSEEAQRVLWCKFNDIFGWPNDATAATRTEKQRRGREVAWHAFQSGADIGNGLASY